MLNIYKKNLYSFYFFWRYSNLEDQFQTKQNHGWLLQSMQRQVGTALNLIFRPQSNEDLIQRKSFCFLIILEYYFLNSQISYSIISFKEQIMDSSRSRKNYYQILGLKPDATTTEIDQAYKKLSGQWHPDKHKANRNQAEAKFHDICQAYDVLSNKNRRSHYDQVIYRPYTNEDAEKTFQQFFEQHGMEDENEQKFFSTYYPDRKRNYYEVLGVPKNSNFDDIKRAYRRLALQYHPKNNPGKQEEARKRFNEVNEAFNALSTQSRRDNYDFFNFGQIAPLRAHSIFEDFWGDRFHELEDDDFFRPVLRNKWSRNLDRMLDAGNEDWSNIKEGQSHKTSSYYTNRNGVESKKSVSTKTKYENGIPISETTEEYLFPDGNKEVRKIKDDGRGNVISKVYNLKKGEQLPIEN